MKFNNLLLLILLVAFVLLATSCKTVTITQPRQGEKNVCGPPAHAPAHGYRRKFPSNVEVVFDSDSGVYVVIGWNKHFWLDGQYYRFDNGQWQVSVAIEDGWKFIREEQLPPGLRKKYVAKQLPNNNPGRGLALGKKK